MRLHPPAPTIPKKAIESVKSGGIKIPKGTGVRLCVAATQVNPIYEFIPERFDESKNRVYPFSFLPFSIGKRSCIGILIISYNFVLQYNLSIPIGEILLSMQNEIMK